jgi:hypothetical protein
MLENDPLHFLKFKRGDDLPHSKMTAEKVSEARKIYAESREAIRKLNDEFSAKGLARRYGVHVRTMEKLLNGETWSHVE